MPHLPWPLQKVEYDYYHLRTSRDVEDLRKTSLLLLRAQLNSSLQNLDILQATRAMGKDINSVLAELKLLRGAASQMIMGLLEIERLGNSIARDNRQIAEHTLGALNILESIVPILMNQQQELSKTVYILTRPYETQTRELRQNADKWLDAGMRSTENPVDRREYWSDALRLYLLVIDNPIGAQDYQVWFNLGWLHWKFQTDLNEARSAFDRARRLAKVEDGVHHRMAIRHLAYIQYLQGDYTTAFQTIQISIALSREFDDLYDAAKYAARVGDVANARSLLEECIRLRPSTTITAFSDDDFLHNDLAFPNVVANLTKIKRNNIARSIMSMQINILKMSLDEAVKTLRFQIEQPDWPATLEDYGFVKLSELEIQIPKLYEAAIASIVSQCEAKQMGLELEIRQLHDQIATAFSDGEQRMRIARNNLKANAQREKTESLQKTDTEYSESRSRVANFSMSLLWHDRVYWLTLVMCIVVGVTIKSVLPIILYTIFVIRYSSDRMKGLEDERARRLDELDRLRDAECKRVVETYESEIKTHDAMIKAQFADGWADYSSWKKAKELAIKTLEHHVYLTVQFKSRCLKRPLN